MSESPTSTSGRRSFGCAGRTSPCGARRVQLRYRQMTTPTSLVCWGRLPRCLPLLWADVAQHRSWTSRICGAGILKSACVLHFAVQEVTQKRPNRGDGAKSTHLLPVRRKRCADDVGGELERERRDQPSREVEPDSAPIRACDSRRAHDPNGVTD